MIEANTQNQGRLKSLALFFCAALIILGGNALLLFHAFDQVREQQKWVEHSSRVMSEMDLLISSMKDAETGVRGFLLTNKQAYLEPYQIGSEEVWVHYRKLKNLTAENKVQTAAVEKVRVAIQDRLTTLENTLKFGQNAKELENFKKSPVVEGKVIMDELRDQVKVMKDEESRVYAERLESARESERLGWGTLVFSAFLNIGLSVLAYYLIRRSYKQQIKESREKSNEAWKQSNLVDLSKLIAADLAVLSSSKNILEFMADIFHFPAANMYVLEGNALRLAGSHALVPSEKNQKILLGEGLLGEAIRRNEMTLIEEVPENYLWISSSLGKAQPRQLLLVPIFFLGEAVAVIELALFEKLSPLQMDLLRHMREVIGTGLNAAISRESLQNLLEKTQLQSEELQAQQEELRASNEELEEQARTLEAQQETLNSRNRQLEITQRDVQQKAADLEKTNQYKSDFLAKMSHELRTPLNSLLILATLLKENKEKNLTEQQKNFAATIHDAGNDLFKPDQRYSGPLSY